MNKVENISEEWLTFCSLKENVKLAALRQSYKYLLVRIHQGRTHNKLNRIQANFHFSISIEI